LYDPAEAEKSYLVLLKEQGASSAIKSAVFVVIMYFFNKITYQQETPISTIIAVYFVFCIYFSWKPKLTRFLRGKLRGEEFRNKADD
jgi:hypothetical protein|tara:strand:+ start:1593 stop:1853 length:261 start_codon:yes stop_codon:yes gene_type:complete